MSDLGGGRVGSESSFSRSGSISSNIIIGTDEEETSMIAVSYGNVLQLFGFRVSEKNEIYFKQIGFIINDKPIVRNCFITNSMIALMSDNLNIKLINTYDFIPKVYNPQNDTNITKNFLISYEYLSTLLNFFSVSTSFFNWHTSTVFSSSLAHNTSRINPKTAPHIENPIVKSGLKCAFFIIIPPFCYQ